MTVKVQHRSKEQLCCIDELPMSLYYKNEWLGSGITLTPPVHNSRIIGCLVNNSSLHIQME